MYYRILIPELLSDYAKVLYLDCDILIQRDISALYDTNISKYMVGAIKNPPHKDITSYKHNTLHIDENLYFNSGILLFNTKKCLDLNLKDTCFDLLKKYPKL